MSIPRRSWHQKEKLAAVGVAIDDSNHCSTILRGIPHYYSTFASSIIMSTHIIDKDKVVSPTALAQAIAEEYNHQKSHQNAQGGRQREKNDDDEALAVSSSAPSQKFGQKTKRTCWKCRKEGHLKHDCKVKVSGSGQGSNGRV